MGKNKNKSEEGAVAEVAEPKAKKVYAKNPYHFSARLGPNSNGKFLTIQTLKSPRVSPERFLARTIVFDGIGKEAKRTYGNTQEFDNYEQARNQAQEWLEAAVAVGWPMAKSSNGRTKDTFQGIPGLDF